MIVNITISKNDKQSSLRNGKGIQKTGKSIFSFTWKMYAIIKEMDLMMISKSMTTQ